MQYRVTIGIPVYRAVDYIEDTMKSVLGQTFTDIEYLIVDDCGNDGTMDIIMNLKYHHSRGNAIRILKNSQNKGVGYSRNRIIDEANGRYLYFLDSDDIIEPYTIQLLYESITQNHAEVSYGSYEIIDRVDSSPTEVYQKEAKLITKDDELATYAFKCSHVFHISVCNCMIDMNFLRHLGLRFIDAQYWEDMVFTYELVPKVSRAVLHSEITYHYLRRVGSLSHYQSRNYFEKNELMKNVSIINYLKRRCDDYKDKDFLPYLCYNLEIISFYIICHTLKHYRRIIPKVSYIEMREIIRHPLKFREILRFRHQILPNMMLWLLGVLPVFMFIPSIWLMGKVKKAI